MIPERGIRNKPKICTKMEQIVNNSPVALTVRRGNFILEKGKNVQLGGIYVFGFIGI